MLEWAISTTNIMKLKPSSLVRFLNRKQIYFGFRYEENISVCKVNEVICNLRGIK